MILKKLFNIFELIWNLIFPKKEGLGSMNFILKWVFIFKRKKVWVFWKLIIEKKEHVKKIKLKKYAHNNNRLVALCEVFFFSISLTLFLCLCLCLFMIYYYIISVYFKIMYITSINNMSAERMQRTQVAVRCHGL